MEPPDPRSFGFCSGIIIHSSPKVFVDTNLGQAVTRDLLISEKPDIVIITHYHPDHSPLGYLVLEYTDAELFIPEGEEACFSSLDFLIEHTAAPLGVSEAWKNVVVDMLHFKEVHQFRSYDRDSNFRLNSIKMELIRTSGHSPSHTSFWFPEEKIIFSGDMGIDRFGPWYGWADCDLRDYIESLMRLKSLEAKVLLTSHGGIIHKNIEDSFTHCLREILHREDRIGEMLEKGRLKEDIIREGVCYKNKMRVNEPMRSILFMWESVMVDHHLKQMAEGGLRREFPEWSKQ
ncbi:MAG: MBL fold metallo-hydrolase [Pseudomonadota bacterium]